MGLRDYIVETIKGSQEGLNLRRLKYKFTMLNLKTLSESFFKRFLKAWLYLEV